MRLIAIALLAVFPSSVAVAQESREQRRPPATDPTARVVTTRQTTRPSEKEEAEREKKAGDRIRVTDHSIRIGGRELKYRATAGTLAQKDEAGDTKADMFFVAYELLGRDDRVEVDEGEKKPPATTRASTRPVTFVFNGGPGAASVWLHIGTAGPKRIELDDEGNPASPPYRLVDNEATWLAATDLVFIDPVGTGYSRPAPGEKGEQFYGVAEDVRSVASFIRLWVTRYERWLSPKFLAGESYGTTRAAGLSEHLLDRHGISLNGIMLISSVLDFQTLSPGDGNELPYALFLPSYAATAWHHKKLPGDLQEQPLEKVLREVEAWALDDYLVALAKGDALREADARVVAERLARFTGLPVEWIIRADLRISPSRFMKQLLVDERRTVGRFDGRMTGFDEDPNGTNPAYDPSLSGYLGVYSADINHYLRAELKYESDLPYEVLSERVRPWNFGAGGSGYLYVADELRDTMMKNPHLKVLFGSGRMDLATPYFATDYTVEHLDLPAKLRGNVIRNYYPAGHMMYHEAGSRKKLGEDVAEFVRGAVAK